jgi:antitoxin component of MazEF toxin-antitoxin module
MVLWKFMGTRRKVQKTSQDQYTITIPKTLIEVLGINKGSEFEFVLSKNMELVLKPVRRGRK